MFANKHQWKCSGATENFTSAALVASGSNLSRNTLGIGKQWKVENICSFMQPVFGLWKWLFE